MATTDAAEAGAPFDERFEVRGQLGAGGVGTVFRVFDRRLGREVALKVLRAGGPKSLFRFKREFRALSDIVHPNLIALHELHTTSEDWFITMELVEGVKFIDWVRRRPLGELDEARLRAALRELADGVHALHLAGKLHRDLKPSNVLVTETGRVVILDFGLISDVENLGSDVTHERAAVGTPAYMSPEQAADLPLTEASDWYAVGVMLYEALTGRRPFEGTPDQILARKQRELPRPPLELAPEAPADLGQLAMALMARAPDQRPDGRSVLAALGAAPSAATAGLERAAAQAPFVGRAAELRTLREAYLDARRKGVSVFVRGDSGMGKTLLVRRFLDELGDEPLVLEGRCYEREQVPYKALDAIVDVVTSVLLRLEPAALNDVIPRDVAALARLFPVLRRVPAITVRCAGAHLPPDPHELRRRAFGALRFLLRQLATDRPVVVWIDDLQWGDADSAVFLGDLVHHPERVLLVFGHRPEDDAGVVARVLDDGGLGAGDVRHVDVGPLDDDAARGLARAIAGAEAAERMVASAGGHPLFLVELARSRGTDDNLEVLWARRVVALPPPAVALLQACAVAGRPLPAEVAARAAGLDGLGTELGPLRGEHLIRLRRTADDATFLVETYHDRVRDVVVGALTEPQRRAIHRALATAWAAQPPGRRRLDAIVDHWLAAGEAARAAELAVEAAAAATEALAFRRAADLYQIALEHGGATGEARRALWQQRGTALVDGGQLEAAAEAFAEAARGAPPEQHRELTRLHLEQLLRRGRLDEGLALARTMLADLGLTLPATQGAVVRTLVVQRIALRLRGTSFRERAEADLAPEALRRVDMLFSVASGLGFVDPFLGRVAQNLYLREALALGEPYRACAALCLELGFLGSAGNRHRARAEALAARLAVLSRRVGHPYVIGLGDASAGLAAFLVGRWREARDLIDSGLRVMRDHGTGVRWEIDLAEMFWVSSLYYLGETRELVRIVPRLLREAVERGDLYAQHGLRGWRSNVAWLIRGEPGEARAHVISVADERPPQEAYNLHHYYELLAHTQIDLYLGDGEGAWARVSAARRSLQRSHLLRVQSVRVEHAFLAGRAALAAAAAAPSAAAAARLLDEARREQRVLAGEKVAWASALGRMLAAGIAAAAGDPAGAATALDEASAELDACDMGLFAHVVRLRRGLVDGGPRGTAAAIAARDWMTEQEVADPDAIAAMLLPWPRR